MSVRSKAEVLAAALDEQDAEAGLPPESSLAPLLQVARLVRDTPHPVLAPAALAAGLARVRQQVAARRPARRWSWARRPAWAALGLSLALVVALVLATAGTVLAAEGTLPGQPLYPVKRAAEAVQLSLTWEPESRSSLLLSLAERRLAEVQAVCPADCPAALLGDLAEQSAAAEAAIEGLPPGRRADLLEKMVALTARQQEVLGRVLEQAPPAARPGLERAMERSRQGHERARQALEKEIEKGKGKGGEKGASPLPQLLKPTKAPRGPARDTPGRGPKRP